MRCLGCGTCEVPATVGVCDFCWESFDDGSGLTRDEAVKIMRDVDAGENTAPLDPAAFTRWHELRGQAGLNRDSRRTPEQLAMKDAARAKLRKMDWATLQPEERDDG